MQRSRFIVSEFFFNSFSTFCVLVRLRWLSEKKLAELETNQIHHIIWKYDFLDKAFVKKCCSHNQLSLCVSTLKLLKFCQVSWKLEKSFKLVASRLYLFQVFDSYRSQKVSGLVPPPPHKYSGKIMAYSSYHYLPLYIQMQNRCG